MRSLKFIALVFGLLRTSSSSPHQISTDTIAPRADQIDPLDPGWLQDFAAIGDSYAAGIGAGTLLSSSDDKACSRYDGAYPSLIQRVAFADKPKLTFLACSGHDSSNIMDQVKKLKDNSLNLITVSAGGNDALLTDVLKACVLLPSNTKSCDSALSDTKNKIDKELSNNIDQLLRALAPKLKQGGMVAYTLYAQFFNADTDACSGQTWNWLRDLVPGQGGIKLTKDLRRDMNNLVLEANTKIRSAISSQSGSTRPSNVKIVVVDWDKAVGDVHGRFCEQGSADDPDDPSNLGLMFSRLNTAPQFIPGDRKLAARGNDGHLDLNDTIQYGSRSVEKRISTPDTVGKVFHPSILGHQLIFTQTVNAIWQEKLKDVKLPPPACAFPQPVTVDTNPTCDMDLASGFPNNLWRQGVYNKFCDEVEKNPTKPLSWIVDSQGNQAPLKSAKFKRTPPPDPDAHNLDQITLNWSGGEGSCGKGCKAAFNAIGQSSCSRTAGQQNIMACAAKSGTGCGPGTFDYSIKPGAGSAATCKTKVPEKPQPGPVVCNPFNKSDVNKCGKLDISDKMLDRAVDAFTTIPKGLHDVKALANQTQVYNRDQNPLYMLNIGYVPGCEDYKTQVIDNPQGKSGDPASVSISATDILKNTFKQCKDNQGMGGYQDYGCIRYGFYPTRIKGIFSDTTPKQYDKYWKANNKWCGD